MRLLRSGKWCMSGSARSTAARAGIPGLLLALILFPATLALSGTPRAVTPADECGYFAAMLDEGGGLA